MSSHSSIPKDLPQFEAEVEYKVLSLAKRKRRNQVVLVISLLISVLLYSSASARNDRIIGVIPFPDEFSVIGSSFSFLFSIGFVLYFYVQGEPFWLFPKKQSDDLVKPGVKNDVIERVMSVENDLMSLAEKVKGFDYKRREKLVSETVEEIKKKASDEIWDELTDQADEIARTKRALAPIDDAYFKARARLLSEVAALGRRGTANLVFGVVTTVAALGILLSMAMNTVRPENYRLVFPSGEVDIAILILMFVPKLSLALFVQVFALFFLRLYKAGFAEIKYFQNELTNLEAKYLGVVSSILAKDEQAVRDASRALLAVERNHILSAGQSTVELEKQKIESRSSAEVLKLLPKILGKRNVE